MTVDWAKLQHAYGRASDTPQHLAALGGGDAEARRAALDHLDMALLHQGFPETATAPAVRAVTALLADGRAHPDTVDELLEFLGDAAGSVSRLAGNAYFAGVLPDLAEAVTEACERVFPLLEGSPDNLVEIARVAGRWEEAAVVVLETVDRRAGTGLLARLGVDIRDRMTDPDPSVRLQAALAHEDDPLGRELILAALPDPPPAGVHQWTLIAAAIRVAGDFDSIADAACEIARRDSWTGADDGWGALLRFAFPKKSRRSGSDAQRAFLAALADNDRIWDPKNGNCALAFQDAGLPHSRGACRQLGKPR